MPVEVLPADGLLAASWLLIALPLAGAAVLLLGGRRTDRWGHLLGTATVVAAFGLLALGPVAAEAAPPSSRPERASPALDTHRSTPIAASRLGGPPQDW